jgi:hypothetical protein
MSSRSHQIQVTKTVQLIDLNDNQNKCIATFRVTPSDITVAYDIAVVSQAMIDSEEWQSSPAFKRFSGNITNTVEIDDDTPQSYYLAIKSAPNTTEDINLNIDINLTPLQVPAQAPAVIQPEILEKFEDDIVQPPWYKTTWGIIIIIAVIAIAAYFGYRFWLSRKDKDVRFKPLVQEKTYTPSAPSAIPSSLFGSRPSSKPVDTPAPPAAVSQSPFRRPMPDISFEDTSKSEYKSHKYRSRERIKNAFSSSSSSSPPPSAPSVPAPAPPAPVEAPAPPSPSVPAPPAPVEAPAPSVQETVSKPSINTEMPFSNRLTSKLFEKLRGSIPHP